MFLDGDERRRRANRAVGIDPILVCSQCGWKIHESAAKARGISNCQQCGNRNCKVHNLDYNLNTPLPARPSVQAILAQEQQQMRRMGRR